MSNVQELPKRPEKPPIHLISQGGETVENPTSAQIVDELNHSVIPQFKVVFELIYMSQMYDNFNFMSNTYLHTPLENMLCAALQRYDQLSSYL